MPWQSTWWLFGINTVRWSGSWSKSGPCSFWCGDQLSAWLWNSDRGRQKSQLLFLITHHKATVRKNSCLWSLTIRMWVCFFNWLITCGKGIGLQNRMGPTVALTVSVNLTLWVPTIFCKDLDKRRSNYLHFLESADDTARFSRLGRWHFKWKHPRPSIFPPPSVAGRLAYQ